MKTVSARLEKLEAKTNQKKTVNFQEFVKSVGNIPEPPPLLALREFGEVNPNAWADYYRELDRRGTPKEGRPLPISNLDGTSPLDDYYRETGKTKP